ncbi:SDR family oxidoreductase [Rhizobium laguerreae]|uniref:SDR family oxidoreductase n=1 Tax=Rhizobium laguerreae TaxID=1076926 RepID=UPI0031BA84D5
MILTFREVVCPKYPAQHQQRQMGSPCRLRLIDTPLWSKLDEGSRKALFDRAAANLPAKVVGQPSDVANAVLYLMTTPFATGSTVRVDGGGVIA